MTDLENLRRLGWIRDEAPKTAETGGGQKENGDTPKENGEAAALPEKPAPTELPKSEPLAVKAVDVPADGPPEVMNVA